MCEEEGEVIKNIEDLKFFLDKDLILYEICHASGNDRKF